MLPTRCAPIAAAFTGVQRSHPVFATAPVAWLPWAWAAAGLSATALASVPPNQADKPTSCRERDRVLRATVTPSSLISGELSRYPPSERGNMPRRGKTVTRTGPRWHDLRVPRGNLWDGVTFGRARRRRRMHRQLRNLDRWYGDGDARRRGGGDGWRRFFVTSVTTVVAVVAALVVLHQQGVVVNLQGVSRLVGRGPSVATGGAGGSYRFMVTQRGSGVPVSYN